MTAPSPHTRITVRHGMPDPFDIPPAPDDPQPPGMAPSFADVAVYGSVFLFGIALGWFAGVVW